MSAIKPGDVLLVDTNAMIEALRVECLRALLGAYRIETVAKCVEELGTGPRAHQKAVELVRSKAVVHAVTQIECIGLLQRYTLADLLDAGERDLLAHAIGRDDAWFLCGPDKATLRALHVLGYLARAVSLEAILRGVNVRPHLNLKANYREQWIRARCVELKIDIRYPPATKGGWR